MQLTRSQISRSLFLICMALWLGRAAEAAPPQPQDQPARRAAGDSTKGKPPILPCWAFGHWVWEDEKNTRKALEYIVNGYLDHNIPVGAVIIDSPWSTSYNDFIFDTEQYPDAQNMIDNLHQKGIKVLVFYTGCINRTSRDTKLNRCPSYRYIVDNNYAIDENRESRWWKGEGVHIDLTNPDAQKWWHTQLDKIHQMGVDGAKVDYALLMFGDTLQTSIGPLTNRDFGYYYFKDSFDYNTARNNEFVMMTYACRKVSESQIKGLIGFPSTAHVNWVGDFTGDWKGIQDQLEGIYASAEAGFSGLACEIGGYWQIPSTKEEFIRYTQLACFVPIMVNGGSFGALKHHLPWNHDEETIDIYRQFVKLHDELSYCLFSLAVDAHLNNSTIIRKPSFKTKSHWLGDQLFVKVITDSTAPTKINLPDTNAWIDYWNTDKTYSAGTRMEKEYDLTAYPVFIRPGAIIPIKQPEHPDRRTFRIYPHGTSEYRFHRPLGQGTDYEDIRIAVDENKGSIRIESPSESQFTLNIKCFAEPDNVSGAERWEYIKSQNLLKVEVAGKQANVKINQLRGYSRKLNNELKEAPVASSR